ncbi:hypothetical protein J9E33_002411 [Salmonella enterica]|uniref:hypothetical protein n=1 Tax=Salmonella enterica TaxID=28901 RepID=UPI0009B05395|nr:hypothetical protein [Salmonella enterica]EBW2268536.1 hypothetical protein [Salmonella enterica subsp. enterica serovar Hillingdon]EDR0865656.1 hypothetical protein [Salmonella enterica subsp. enterica serovar Hillingdon]EDR6326948.1 hypothetical protein [Salmonella enterica subsp. enterica serovar Hillingdon]EFO5895651.1 hypothetical protein [Salmonella enterica]EFO8529208.1 hypothetical protein [Salmonella enterica]
MTGKARSIVSTGYLTATLYTCLGVWISLESQRFATGWFVLALFFVFARWYRYRDKTPPSYRLHSSLLLIPLLLTLAGTAIHIHTEADTGDYQELVNGVRWTQDDYIRQQIKDQVSMAMLNDGEISVAEAARIRHFITDKTGILMRADAADTQEQARKRLADILNTKDT